MRLILLLLLCNYGVIAQNTLLKYDYAESFSWSGVWFNLSPGNYYNYASVSPTNSAAIFGLGGATSLVEQNWYSMPNVTGLNSSYLYEFRFRLASYYFSNSTATTKGVDVADVLEVKVSTDGGATYVTELRVTGNGNSYWDYNTVGVINHTANKSFSSSNAPAGDVYVSGGGNNTNLSTGYSVVTLKLPLSITQVAVDIFVKANSAGEEWWFDNIELWQIKPIALSSNNISIDGYNKECKNTIIWTDDYESNYYSIDKSTDGANWNHIGDINSNASHEYSFNDYEFTEVINYYLVKRYDINGEFNIIGTIAIDNSDKKKYILKVYDLTGREVDLNFDGVKVILYSDGSTITIFN